VNLRKTGRVNWGKASKRTRGYFGQDDLTEVIRVNWGKLIELRQVN